MPDVTNPTDMVDGTGGPGQTCPGQGRQYNDPIIMGFSRTHFSGAEPFTECRRAPGLRPCAAMRRDGHAGPACSSPRCSISRASASIDNPDFTRRTLDYDNTSLLKGDVTRRTQGDFRDSGRHGEKLYDGRTACFIRRSCGTSCSESSNPFRVQVARNALCPLHCLGTV